MQVKTKAVTNHESTKCDTCEFGKGNFQTNKVKKIKKNPMKDKELNKDHIMPGHMVYVDHYISRDTVRIYQTRGKSDPSEMFSGG